VRFALAAGLVVAVLAVVALLVEAPVVVWGLLRGELVAVDPFVIAGAAIGAWFGRDVPDDWDVALAVPAGTVPPLGVAVVVDGLVLAGVAFACWAAWLRIDRWRGRSHAAGSDWSPRRLVRARAWAKPRDWLHLQPREGSGAIRRRVSGLVRLGLWERRVPDAVDSWALGRLRRAVVWSDREQHLIGFAPTRSGKTLRLLVEQVRRHRGPAVVMSNKLDVVMHTVWRRALSGPVWIIAPGLDHKALRQWMAGWTPLRTCRDWPGALMMAQWLYDADPTASATSRGSDGGRFYNRQAVEALLPAVLHAAALEGRQMVDVLRWVRGGAQALEEPRLILADHDALAGEVALLDVQALDAKTLSLLSATASQLVSAYRLPAVQVIDHAGFDPVRLRVECGTVYLIADDSMQEALAPIFGGIVGEVLRDCDWAAAHTRDPRELPITKVLIDEAANLAPLRKLPTALSISAGMNVRFALIYQSVAQLRARYGADADTILANAGAKVFLGPISDAETRRTVIDAFGEEDVETTSYTGGTWGAAGSRTTRTERRSKLSADDLARLPEGVAVVLHGRDLPARVKLRFWWQAEGARDPEEAIARDRADWQQRGKK
jgi:hypothetical protein